MEMIYGLLVEAIFEPIDDRYGRKAAVASTLLLISLPVIAVLGGIWLLT